MIQFETNITGLLEAQAFFDRQPQIARRAARLATNDAAQRRAIPLGRQLMLQQVAFPPGYLSRDRFFMSQRATDSDLEARVKARFTPTSLARFTGRRTLPQRRVRRAGSNRRATALTVKINPGRVTSVGRAFLINLRNGNLGLAIRLRPGESLHRTLGAKLITTGPLKGVALLYGPSVDQVFRTVSGDISPQVLDFLEDEFLRQYIRLSGSEAIL